MVELIGKEPSTQDDAQIQQHWGNLGVSMFTLLKVATFDDWYQRLLEVLRYKWWLFIPLGIFISVISLGLLNLVVGVMVQCALQVVREEVSEKDRRSQIKT